MRSNDMLRRHWVLTEADLRKEAPYYVTVGILVGFVRWISYRLLQGRNWGSDLLQEHIVFNGLAAAIFVLAAIRAATHLRSIPRGNALQLSRTFSLSVSARASTFASVGAAAIFGFAWSAVLCGSFWYAFKFAEASIYFASLGEVAANLAIGRPHSKSFECALLIVISMPLLF